MAVHGIGSIGTQPLFQPASPRPGGAQGGLAGADGSKPFGEALKEAVDGVDASQQASAATIQDLLTGKSEDVLPVVQAVAKADMSFKLLIGVRNKVIEAYKQTINMQV